MTLLLYVVEGEVVFHCIILGRYVGGFESVGIDLWLLLCYLYLNSINIRVT